MLAVGKGDKLEIQAHFGKRKHRIDLVIVSRDLDIHRPV